MLFESFSRFRCAPFSYLHLFLKAKNRCEGMSWSVWPASVVDDVNGGTVQVPRTQEPETLVGNNIEFPPTKHKTHTHTTCDTRKFFPTISGMKSAANDVIVLMNHQKCDLPSYYPFWFILQQQHYQHNVQQFFQR